MDAERDHQTQKPLENASKGESVYQPVVCSDCGHRWGRERPLMAKWDTAECGVCGVRKTVTPASYFGGLIAGHPGRLLSKTLRDQVS